MRHEGGCLCGGVRYHVAARPRDIINCSCSFCQRATGSAYLVETTFDKDAVVIDQGPPRVYDHVSGGSGKLVHIHFCPDCGTKLFMTFDRFPEIAGVFTGTFDDPNWLAQSDRDAAMFFFLGKAQDGTVIPAGHDVYHAHFWHRDGVPATPRRFSAPQIVTPEFRAESEAFSHTHDGD